MTVLWAQSDSSKICLKYKQFDYYAQSVVDRNQLKKDTINLRKILKSQAIKLTSYQNIIQGDSISFIAKDSIASIFKIAFYKEQAVEIKKDKVLKRYKNLSLILSSAVVVLIAVLVIIH